MFNNEQKQEIIIKIQEKNTMLRAATTTPLNICGT